MTAERYDDLPALAEIRDAIERELRTGQPVSSRRTPRRWRVLPVAAGLAVPLAVLVLALLVLHGSDRSGKTATHTDSVAGRQALIDELGVLRRPQTTTDLPTFLRSILRQQLPFQGRADLPLVRYATTTPWGSRVYVVPRRPLTATQLREMHLSAAQARYALGRDETVGVFTRGGGGGGLNATALAKLGSLGSSGNNNRTRYIDLVPDDVATVTFLVGRQPQRGIAFAPTYRHVRSVTVAVNNNIAAVQIDRETSGGGAAVIWRGAHGQVLRRVGDFRGLNRVQASATPGPQTPASRAAERNPTTPNPVTVTPTIGGPDTAFKLHFTQLLNNADYTWDATGPRCPAIHGGGGELGASGLRGRTFTQTVSPISTTRFCRGTYHLAVYLSDYGLHGRASGRVRSGNEATPFGTATFTVR